MIIAIGSLRQPKIIGVKMALKKLSKIYKYSYNDIEFVTVNSVSNVSDTPTSIEELISGAKQRAKFSFNQIKSKSKFGVGVEGGVFKIRETGFLQSWTVVYDGKNYFSGASSAIELPKILTKELFVNKKDLGKIIDSFSQQKNVRSKNGTWGILTNNFYTRKDSFCDATVNAFIPIFNQKVYSQKK